MVRKLANRFFGGYQMKKTCIPFTDIIIPEPFEKLKCELKF